MLRGLSLCGVKMRLLHIPSMKIVEYQGEGPPPYAILSHTWSIGEVLFSDFQEGREQQLRGYSKITGCCEQATSDGLEYVWIDTCCIDKRSSSELSEAINSMFGWYQNAAICYAYLGDVDEGQVAEFDDVRGHHGSSSFSKSRWFTRGWTLQELLAPSHVVFFSGNWSVIGTRDQLKDIIAKTTAIDAGIFDNGVLEAYSIAQRMSWASGRATTRIEDQAYCLLGLFGVNIPLLYGEGQRAFVRLQREIMRESDDHSIFAWSSGQAEDDSLNGGILASSPSQFASSGHIRRPETTEFYPPYAITNKGVQISLPVFEAESNISPQLIAPQTTETFSTPSVTLTMTSLQKLAVLNCHPLNNDALRIGIFIDRPQETLSHLRTYYDLGLVTVSLDEVRGKATRVELLIRTHNQSVERLIRPFSETDELLFTQPLVAKFTLHRVVPDMKWHCESADHGPLTIKGLSTLNWRQNWVLEFRDPEGHTFLLVLQRAAPRKIRVFIAENAQMAASEKDINHQARDAIDRLRVPGDRVAHQESSSGLLYLSPRIRERPHALILSL
ncbi:heterokaryon incompatibility protein-domain-containing protein [Nemania abortiva]|nr:heterokaryon incompatibility protein-domain-containing protein [Nemania abortiva]